MVKKAITLTGSPRAAPAITWDCARKIDIPRRQRRHLNRRSHQYHLQIDTLGLKNALFAPKRNRQIVQTLRRISEAHSIGGMNRYGMDNPREQQADTDQTNFRHHTIVFFSESLFEKERLRRDVAINDGGGHRTRHLALIPKSLCASFTRVKSATSFGKTWRVTLASFIAASITACRPSAGIFPSPLNTRTTES